MAAITTETTAKAVTSEDQSQPPPNEDKLVLDKLAQGIFGILGPSVNEIDERVKEVRLASAHMGTISKLV